MSYFDGFAPIPHDTPTKTRAVTETQNTAGVKKFRPGGGTVPTSSKKRKVVSKRRRG